MNLKHFLDAQEQLETFYQNGVVCIDPNFIEVKPTIFSLIIPSEPDVKLSAKFVLPHNVQVTAVIPIEHKTITVITVL